MQSARASLHITVTPGGLLVGERLWTEAPSLDDIRSVLGDDLRVETGDPPAPVGHRNNHSYVCDRLGIEFRDHHLSRRVTSMAVYFAPGSSERSPRTEFTGELTAWGYRFSQAMREQDCGQLPVQRYLAGLYHGLVGAYPVYLCFEAPRHPRTGRRSGVRTLESLWVHFEPETE